jgi:SAM-dependent methyltransferase
MEASVAEALRCTPSSLSSARPEEKHRLLDSLVNGMLEGEASAGTMAILLANSTSARYCPPQPHNTQTAHGHFSADSALKFLQNTNRLKGFIGAIQEWDEPESVIDVGCGPFPVLALAAAALHKTAEVTAVEINSESASRAADVVDMFGLSDRVNVVNTDIANHKIDANTSAAVTETFNAALALEPGPQIVRLLYAAGVPVITPSRAKLRFDAGNLNIFHWVDLRVDTHANIDLTELAENDIEIDEPPGISAAFYDDGGLVLGYDEDTISSQMSIHNDDVHLFKSKASEAPGAYLTYELGTDWRPAIKQRDPRD